MKKSYADMNPLEEIRAIRAEIMHEFKTIDALFEHLDATSSAANPVTKSHEKPAGRRKAGKHLVHA